MILNHGDIQSLVTCCRAAELFDREICGGFFSEDSRFTALFSIPDILYALVEGKPEDPEEEQKAFDRFRDILLGDEPAWSVPRKLYGDRQEFDVPADHLKKIVDAAYAYTLLHALIHRITQAELGEPYALIEYIMYVAGDIFTCPAGVDSMGFFRAIFDLTKPEDRDLRHHLFFEASFEEAAEWVEKLNRNGAWTPLSVTMHKAR